MPNTCLLLGTGVGHDVFVLAAGDQLCLSRDLLGTRGRPAMVDRLVDHAEMIRDWSRRLFVRALQAYTPEIELADVAWGPSGIRAQALQRDGSLVDDFVIGGDQHVLHVQNAPSPAATASLAIGRVLAEMAIERFGI